LIERHVSSDRQLDGLLDLLAEALVQACALREEGRKAQAVELPTLSLNREPASVGCNVDRRRERNDDVSR
jgi:hypothetical protein